LTALNFGVLLAELIVLYRCSRSSRIHDPLFPRSRQGREISETKGTRTSSSFPFIYQVDIRNL